MVTGKGAGIQELLRVLAVEHFGREMTTQPNNVTVVSRVSEQPRIEKQVRDGGAKFVVTEPTNQDGAPWVACYARQGSVEVAVASITPQMAVALAVALQAAVEWLAAEGIHPR